MDAGNFVSMTEKELFHVLIDSRKRDFRSQYPCRPTCLLTGAIAQSRCYPGKGLESPEVGCGTFPAHIAHADEKMDRLFNTPGNPVT